MRSLIFLIYGTVIMTWQMSAYGQKINMVDISKTKGSVLYKDNRQVNEEGHHVAMEVIWDNGNYIVCLYHYKNAKEKEEWSSYGYYEDYSWSRSNNGNIMKRRKNGGNYIDRKDGATQLLSGGLTWDTVNSIAHLEDGKINGVFSLIDDKPSFSGNFERNGKKITIKFRREDVPSMEYIYNIKDLGKWEGYVSGGSQGVLKIEGQDDMEIYSSECLASSTDSTGVDGNFKTLDPYKIYPEDRVYTLLGNGNFRVDDRKGGLFIQQIGEKRKKSTKWFEFKAP